MNLFLGRASVQFKFSYVHKPKSLLAIVYIDAQWTVISIHNIKGYIYRSLTQLYFWNCTIKFYSKTVPCHFHLYTKKETGRVLIYDKNMAVTFTSCVAHSWFNSYAPKLVPIFYSVMKRRYRSQFVEDLCFFLLFRLCWKHYWLNHEFFWSLKPISTDRCKWSFLELKNQKSLLLCLSSYFFVKYFCQILMSNTYVKYLCQILMSNTYKLYSSKYR